MDTSRLEIESERLRLKAVSLDYQEEIFREFTAEITVFMVPEPPRKNADTIEYIQGAMRKNKAGEDFSASIFDKKNGEFLGGGGLTHIKSREPHLGIWIKKLAHGHGYGKEAVNALKEWAEENLDYDYLVYPVDRANYSSRRIPESLGGKISAEYEKICPSGKKLNTVEYRIYKSTRT